MNNDNIFLHILNVFFEMFWQIFWPLAFGLILSSFIRRLLPVEMVIKHLGHTNVKSLSLTTLLGMMSSSCSYAAASLSHTLLSKKATLANSMAFLVSSTNLILEMFIVLVALLGWTFLWGEILGGLLLIIFVAVLFHFFYPHQVEQSLRAKLALENAPVQKSDPHNNNMSDCCMDMSSIHKDDDCAMDMTVTNKTQNHAQATTTLNKIKTKITQSASAFHMDLSMIGKEILIGIVVSSLLIALVPLEGWRDLFISSDTQLPAWLHSFLDVLIGIGVAVIAYVCSVGNLLLAAALWHGGISFGGVIGFILADVLTIPMIRVYRKYYGAKPTTWMVSLLFIAILATGLSVDAIFTAFGIDVSSKNLRPLIQDGFGWNSTTILNLIFIPLSIWYYLVGKKANSAMDMKM